ncbi:hypothetical protein DSECCO2_476060 [anaerobic digester metagenome]
MDIMPEPDIEIAEQNNESKGTGIEVKPEQTENKVTPEKEKISMPGFELIYCIIGLLGVLCRRR